jgi:hypothetical protein
LHCFFARTSHPQDRTINPDTIFLLVAADVRAGMADMGSKPSADASHNNGILQSIF